MDVAGEITHHIHVVHLVDPLVHIGALAGEIPVVVLIGLRVLQIDRVMRNVEVPAHHGLPATACRLILQLLHALGHRVEETVLLRLLRVVHQATHMHVHAHDGDHIPLFGANIRLDPAPRIHVFLESGQSHACFEHRHVADHAHAGAPLDSADVHQRMQFLRRRDLAGMHIVRRELAVDVGDDLLRRARLLHAPDIRRMRLRPVVESFAFGRTDAVQIRGCDCQSHA